MIGQRFSKLVVIKSAGKDSQNNRMWECLCDCGVTKTVRALHLKSGGTKSCGCLLKESSLITHGMSKTKIFRTWDSIKGRCTRIKNKDYPDYGGRGIYICDRWLNSFENFYNDMGPRPVGLEIDRKDNDGPYSPDNCHWTTKKINGRNRRNNIILTYLGESLTLPEWSEKTKINEPALRLRIKSGWEIEKALTTPIRRKTNAI